MLTNIFKIKRFISYIFSQLKNFFFGYLLFFDFFFLRLEDFFYQKLSMSAKLGANNYQFFFTSFYKDLDVIHQLIPSDVLLFFNILFKTRKLSNPTVIWFSSLVFIALRGFLLIDFLSFLYHSIKVLEIISHWSRRLCFFFFLIRFFQPASTTYQL